MKVNFKIEKTTTQEKLQFLLGAAIVLGLVVYFI